jgi:hypothetical protein
MTDNGKLRTNSSVAYEASYIFALIPHTKNKEWPIALKKYSLSS